MHVELRLVVTGRAEAYCSAALAAAGTRLAARPAGLLPRLTLAFCVFGVGVELAAVAVLHLQLVPGHVPGYAPFAARAYEFWADLNPDFGVWHYPDATYRHKKSCFDVTYRTNSAGARDRERSLDSASARIVVLGDSFMEGFGVEHGQRLSDILEAETGIEHLNFATSGFFGPTQYLIAYRTLAKRYRHDAVLVGLLPANDFDEDDLATGQRMFPTRYRPYLVGDYPDYRLEYFIDDLEKSSYRAPPPSFKREVSDVLREISHAYNVYRYYRDLQSLRDDSPEDRATPSSRYRTFTEQELLRLRFVLEQLVAEAGGRPVTVVAIPARRDLAAHDGGAPAPLSLRLEKMGRDVGVRFVDLLPSFSAVGPEWSRYFLSCDGHWSVEGNAAAARVVIAHDLLSEAE